MEQHELRAWEAKCIQEEPPFCTAACPIHVDVRAFADAVAKGKWAEARKLLERSMPLPSVLGRICDHPCELACKRAEAGDAIAIGALEKACVERTEAGRVQKLPVRVKRTAAVLGSELSGLAAAWDLAKKGFEVTVYSFGGKRGGALRDLPEDVLPQEALDEELGRLERLGVTFLDAPALDKALLETARAEFEAVYLSLDAGLPDSLGLATDATGAVELDPISLATSLPGVFAGGRPGEGGPSVIGRVADGRRGAASIDRFLQGSSLTISREKEGAHPTRLFTSIADVEPLPRVAPGSAAGYSEEEARAEAERCLRCECKECVKVCAYLEHFKGYPKKYAREIYNNESIVRGNRTANTLIDSCSYCGLCAEVCPNDFNMADLCAQIRVSMVTRGNMPPSAHDFALRDMAFSDSEMAAMTGHEPGTDKSAYAFFPGCQITGSSPKHVESVYAHLRKGLKGGVGLMLHCCGAPAFWAGRQDLLAKSLDEIRTAWKELGQPTLVLACSTCLSTFKTHAPELPVVSLWEILEDIGLPETAQAGPAAAEGPYALHDPCTTRHEPKVQASVRRILGSLGCEIEELRLSGELTECCGFGGLMEAANPELGRKVALRRAGRSPMPYLAYCAMCRDSLAREGKPVTHILDLLFPGSADTPPANKPTGAKPLVRRGLGFADRHENRARLKRSLLKKLWNEEGPAMEPYEGIRLELSAEVQDVLDTRRILKEDLQKAILHGERTGDKLRKPETGHFLVSHKPAAVTYWVEYSPAPDGPDHFMVHRAWSHRMVVLGGVSE